MAREFGVDASQNGVEKISSFESPEKWTTHHKEVSNFADSAILFKAMKHNLSLLALRVLLDAFLNKLGYRNVEWTLEERAEWEHKKRSAGLTRDQLIEKYKGQLIGYGFSESELSALFNADKRTEMNSALHEMKINEIVASLGGLAVSEESRSAIEKAFYYVCGFKIQDVDPNSQDVITSKGICSRAIRDEWLFGDDVGSWSV